MPRTPLSSGWMARTTPSAFSPDNPNVWKQGLASLYPGVKMENEWWRHNRRCNTVWVDGHVSAINYSQKGVDYRWYTGEAPLQQPR
ncbi:MAG: hypothetical protein ACYDC1_23625 [Limisphaerales bacterium]